MGRPLKYKPNELLDKFEEYLCWIRDNPVEVETEFRAVKQRGEGGNANEKGATVRKQKMLRPATIRGFLVHIGMSRQGWDDLENGKRGKEFSAVKSIIKDYCENNQLEGATLGIYNGNIVSRLLGLKEAMEHSGKVETDSVSREEILAELKRLERLTK